MVARNPEGEKLLAGVDGLAILPTAFGKSLIYQVFCLAKHSSNPNAKIKLRHQISQMTFFHFRSFGDLK